MIHCLSAKAQSAKAGITKTHMDYVKIPQNVRVEDKLIGPLSLRQIIMIAIGGGISYVLYAGINKSVGYVSPAMHAIIWWPAIILGAFAVIRINDISLFRYVLLILEMLSKPRKRIFQPRRGLEVTTSSAAMIRKFERQKEKNRKKQEGNEPGQKKSDVRLEELSVILDQEGNKVPTPPASYNG